MLTPLFAIIIIVISTLGILKLTPWLLKQANAYRGITSTMFFTAAMVSVMIEILILFVVLFCEVAPNDFAKTAIPEHPVVITIDKLIAGEEIPLEEMRPLLAATTYPCAELWANRKNIPEDRKEYVIETVAEAIRQATVKIELPAEFVSEIETAGVPLQTQKEN